MEKQRIYIDGVESVSLTEGMIRMELFAVQTASKSNTNHEHQIFAELIMSPQGFMRSFSTMENLVEQLKKAGIVKRSTPPAGQSSAPQPVQTSPNFN